MAAADPAELLRGAGRCWLAALPSVALLAACTSAPHDSTLIRGTGGDDRLSGTSEADTFVGGRGADVFVVDAVGDTPDTVLDFSVEEGDSVEVAVTGQTAKRIEPGDFSVNRKGVVTWRIAGRDRALVDLQQSDLKLRLDARKKRVVLKFSRKF